MAGLRPFSEAVWPGVHNDLFVAHESIYRFCARYVADCDVLDAGCGTGYGASILARLGAKSVQGVDLDAKNVAFARKHYSTSSLSFTVADIEKLDFSGGSFDVIVASNSVEHLHHPEAFLARVRDLLRIGGKAIIAVPPIYTPADAAVHAGIRYHRSNLSVGEWADLIRKSGFDASAFFHRVREGVKVDLSLHQPSKLCAADFLFVPTTVEGLQLQPSITAIFLITLPSP